MRATERQGGRRIRATTDDAWAVGLNGLDIDLIIAALALPVSQRWSYLNERSWQASGGLGVSRLLMARSDPVASATSLQNGRRGWPRRAGGGTRWTSVQNLHGIQRVC